MKKAMPIERISALAELERFKLAYEPRSDTEVAVCCPVHGDEKASASLNIEKNLWRCHAAGCNGKGDIISLLAFHAQVDRATIITKLSQHYDLQEIKSLSLALVEKYHTRIWDAAHLMKALRDRGVNDDMIRVARLGEHDGRIQIPIPDEHDRIANIRKYLPGAPGPEKMLNTKGYGAPRLYRIKDLQYKQVWLLGGEIKALVAGEMLNAFKIGAVAVTAGEGAWEAEFTERFKDKVVFICMDVDAGGRAAALKLAKILTLVAEKVFIIRLPLDRTQYPKGDVNDYVGQCGATVGDLLGLMSTADEYFDSKEVEAELEVVETKLVCAALSANMGKLVKLEAMVQAMDETAYIAPKRVSIGCAKDQPNCTWCPVRPIDQDEVTGKVELTIKGTSEGLLSIVNSPKSLQREAVREALRIPVCKTATFTVRESTDVFDVRLAPQLEISGSNHDHVVQPAFIVGSRVELNVPYEMKGRVYPNPRTQQAVLVIDEITKSKDSLSEFQPDVEDYARLKVFETDDIQGKLDAIYSDFETNVTGIFHRRDLHLIVDLTFHSPLYFTMDGRVEKGWINSVIIGDSSQGKSETTQRLMRHYGLGERVDCKNASVAGLLGGLAQLGNRWMVAWGVIPIHDRRIVVLEEVKGASTEVLARLTDMRSSGVAEIPKIEKRRSHARTRLIFVSNPRSNRPMADYNFGIETIQELFGGLEDVRRCDVALVVSSSQVDSATIQGLRINRPQRPHVYTAELTRLLVLWCWTRKPEQVVFERDAEVACYEQAMVLCKLFSEALPLVDKGTAHLKLARLAAALAGRLFSHPKGDPSTLLVRKEHVTFVADWLKRMYSDPVFGYADFTRAQEFSSTVTDVDAVRAQITSTKHPQDLVNHLLHSDEISETDIADWCDVDRDEARKILSLLVRKHALYRRKRWYHKSSEFITLLKSLKSSSLKTTTSKKEEF